MTKILLLENSTLRITNWLIGIRHDMNCPRMKSMEYIEEDLEHDLIKDGFQR